MRKNVWLVLGLGFALVSGRAAMADVWDVQTQNDNTPATENELVHGSDQMHDLGALAGPPVTLDTDWYQLSQKPYSSYEIVVDATSGDIGTGLAVNRTNDTGATTLQTSDAVGVGYSRSLRWMNSTSSEVNNERVSVSSPPCGTGCGTDDVYRLRAYETTYAVPRFNNSGTQITVLLLQNPTNYPISGNIYFWNANGTLNTTSAFGPLVPKQLLVLQTQLVTPVGSTGAVTVAHNGRFGDLSGKTVALEPATGFSFDTPMIARVH